MKSYVLVTPQMDAMLDKHFLASCPDDLEITVIRKGMEGDYGWGTGTFVKAVSAKIDGVIDSIRLNQGDIVVWFDVDIQFFGRCSSKLLDCLGDSDLCFQSEFWPPNGKINAGVIVIRCNSKTLAFFEEVKAHDYSSLRYFDQTLIQSMLDEHYASVRWGVLSVEFWAYSHGGTPPDGMVLHHANVEGVLGKKIEQLTAVREYLRVRRKFRWAWGCIDYVHQSKIASRLARCVPNRLRIWVKQFVRHGAQVRYRPSYEEWA